MRRAGAGMVQVAGLFAFVLVGVALAASGCSSDEAAVAPGVLPTEEAGVEAPGDAAAGDARSSATTGASGDPCETAADCKGTAPECVKERSGISYPGGVCTSTCDAKKNDANGLNPDCPGTRGVCNVRVGKCLRACTEKTGANPCRDGYACFDDETAVCAPETISQCHPSKAGECTSADGGARACIKVGYDDVGLCVAGCSPFTQDCTQNGYACFPNASGEGTCLTTAGKAAGAACIYKNDCAKGLGCAASGVCRPYCGGPSNVACTNGKACIDFDTKVKKTVVGLCDG